MHKHYVYVYVCIVSIHTLYCVLFTNYVANHLRIDVRTLLQVHVRCGHQMLTFFVFLLFFTYGESLER